MKKDLVLKFNKKIELKMKSLKEKFKIDPMEHLEQLNKVKTEIWDFRVENEIYEDTDKVAAMESSKIFLVHDKELKEAHKNLIEDQLNHPESREDLLVYLERERLFYLIGELLDEKSFSLVLKRAEEQLVKEYYDTNPIWILLLEKFYKKEIYRERILNFINKSFDVLKDYAIKKETLINQVSYNALCRLIGLLKEKKLSDLLMDAFTLAAKHSEEDFDDEELAECACHYSLNLTAGTAAIALASLEYDKDLSPFDKFFEFYEWRYKGNKFVMEVKYAQWILEKDYKAAISFIENLENIKGVSYAATALADMGAKIAIEILENRLEILEDAVSVEVFKEAIERLKLSNEDLEKEPMIKMFGFVTDSEIDLGVDNDNEFILRA